MYHQVGTFDHPREHRATFCEVSRFKAQMAYLYHLGYHVISLQDCVDALLGRKTVSENCVVLTFDDGYQNFYDYAFPVLQKYGFPATVFIVSSLLGKTAQWLADDGRYDPPLMNIDTICKLRAHGITFGSHTRTHPKLSQIGKRQQIEEIVRSKAELEDILGEEIKHFCYPSGDFTDNVVRMVQETGYTSALSCVRGSVTTGDNPFILPRKAISYGDSLIGFWWKLHMKHQKKCEVTKVS